jgi:hypothetical protein
MMKKTSTVSAQTRNNWLLDVGLFVSGLLVLLSSVYFLYLPTNGYAGGRNPAYNLQLLFDRHTWDDLHTWAGAAMILIAAVHLIWHWTWVVNMTHRAWKELIGKCGCMNARGRWNLILNIVVALTFLAAAISGLYFLFFPGEHGSSSTALLLFTRSTWDLIHTWSGVIFSLAAILHFSIHWKWVTKVTRKITAQPLPTRPLSQEIY